MKRNLLILVLISSLLCVRVCPYIYADKVSERPMNNSKSLTIGALGIGEAVTGFTLAEVLATLTVVGVVAALTIPALITNIQDAQNRTAFKKVFSDISQATLKMQTDNAIWDYGDGSTSDTYDNNMVAAYRNYVSIVKTGTVSNIFSFQTPFQYKLYYGDIDTNWQAYANFQGGVQLNNGVLMEFRSRTGTYSSGYTRRGVIFIDVNGSKGPNMSGIDFFGVNVYQRTNSNVYIALPWGSPIVQDGYSCQHGSSDYTTSRGCSYNVINDQPMP